MRRVMGEVSPATVLADPPPSLLADLGRELARIHAVPLEKVPAAIPLAIKWCEEHLPDPARPVLVHGDYRMGNVIVDGDGLAAVLDWELAHRGDAHEDLAFGCMSV